MIDALVAKTFAAVALAGAGCGLIGVFVYLLNIPFVGVAIAHSAMAGGVWGVVLGFPGKISAIITSLAASLAIGPLSDRARINANTTLSIIFSAAMGLAFLGAGLTGTANNPVSGYLWGSVFLVTWGDIAAMSAVLVWLVVFIAAFYRQYSAMLFSREIAASLGIHEKRYYYILLLVIGCVVAINLDVIGGLMLFSLVITPPAIAYQLTYDLKKFFAISALSGAAGGCGGAAVSFFFNWPVSASVVLFTTALFIAAAVFSPKRHEQGKINS